MTYFNQKISSLLSSKGCESRSGFIHIKTKGGFTKTIHRSQIKNTESVFGKIIEDLPAMTLTDVFDNAKRLWGEEENEDYCVMDEEGSQIGEWYSEWQQKCHFILFLYQDEGIEAVEKYLEEVL